MSPGKGGREWEAVSREGGDGGFPPWNGVRAMGCLPARGLGWGRSPRAVCVGGGYPPQRRVREGLLLAAISFARTTVPLSDLSMPFHIHTPQVGEPCCRVPTVPMSKILSPWSSQCRHAINTRPLYLYCLVTPTPPAVFRVQSGAAVSTLLAGGSCRGLHSVLPLGPPRLHPAAVKLPAPRRDGGGNGEIGLCRAIRQQRHQVG